MAESAIHTTHHVINFQFPFKIQLKNHLFWKIPLDCLPNTFDYSPSLPSSCCRCIQCCIHHSVLYFITLHICMLRLRATSDYVVFLCVSLNVNLRSIRMLGLTSFWWVRHLRISNCKSGGSFLRKEEKLESPQERHSCPKPWTGHPESENFFLTSWINWDSS